MRQRGTMAFAWAVALVLALVATLASGDAQAWDCKHEKTIEQTLDLSGSEVLGIAARAGDLEVTGHANRSEARIQGKICASKEEWLNETRVATEGGSQASIAVETPDMESGWSFFGSRYLYVDLEIEVPAGMALDIQDSSGDVTVRGTGPVQLRDSSGDIALEDVNGGVVLEDSSGDIDLRGVKGDVVVRQDSSGDLYGSDIQGSVLVERDSSGDIRFEDVQGDYVVERDSSGDIVARNVSGAFRVLKDSSGDISHTDVAGDVELPEDS